VGGRYLLLAYAGKLVIATSGCGPLSSTTLAQYNIIFFRSFNQYLECFPFTHKSSNFESIEGTYIVRGQYWDVHREGDRERRKGGHLVRTQIAHTA
jgi:hypothetical protein